MNYFNICESVEEVKALYRTLARQYHPDLGGDLETMKEINRQYENALKGRDGQESIGTDSKTHTYRYNQEIEAELMEKIEQLMALIAKGHNLDVVLIGRWIWITGETKPAKEALGKDGLGCRWHRDRCCWFWRSAKDRGYGKGGNLEELASKYGCQDFGEKAKSKKRGLKST